MFYSNFMFVLRKDGALKNVWIAAHTQQWERKLKKTQVMLTAIDDAANEILHVKDPNEGDGEKALALRLSGQLMLGLVRIYSRKVRYLQEDSSESYTKMKMQYHKGKQKKITLDDEKSGRLMALPDDRSYGLDIPDVPLDELDRLIAEAGELTELQDVSEMKLKDKSRSRRRSQTPDRELADSKKKKKPITRAPIDIDEDVDPTQFDQRPQHDDPAAVVEDDAPLPLFDELPSDVTPGGRSKDQSSSIRDPSPLGGNVSDGKNEAGRGERSTTPDHLRLNRDADDIPVVDDNNNNNDAGAGAAGDDREHKDGDNGKAAPNDEDEDTLIANDPRSQLDLEDDEHDHARKAAKKKAEKEKKEREKEKKESAANNKTSTRKRERSKQLDNLDERVELEGKKINAWIKDQDDIVATRVTVQMNKRMRLYEKSGDKSVFEMVWRHPMSSWGGELGLHNSWLRAVEAAEEQQLPERLRTVLYAPELVDAYQINMNGVRIRKPAAAAADDAEDKQVDEEPVVVAAIDPNETDRQRRARERKEKEASKEVDVAGLGLEPPPNTEDEPPLDLGPDSTRGGNSTDGGDVGQSLVMDNNDEDPFAPIPLDEPEEPINSSIKAKPLDRSSDEKRGGAAGSADDDDEKDATPRDRTRDRSRSRDRLPSESPQLQEGQLGIAGDGEATISGKLSKQAVKMNQLLSATMKKKKTDSIELERDVLRAGGAAAAAEAGAVNRVDAAACFFQLLVLKSRNVVDVQQKKKNEYGPITVTKGPRFNDNVKA